MEHSIDSEFIKDVLRVAVSALDFKYADACFDFRQSLHVTKNKVEENVLSPSQAGVCLRAWDGADWSYASTSKLDWKSIMGLISKISPKKGKGKIKLIDPWTCDETFKEKKKAADFGIEERLKRVRELYKAAKFDKRIVDVRMRMSTYLSEKIIFTSEGSELRQVIPKVNFICMPVAKGNGRIDYDYISDGGIGGLEVLRRITPAAIKRCAKSSIALLDAVEPMSGKINAIIDGDVAGVLAHETFGHGTEADQVLRKRSYLAPYIGKKLAARDVTVIDSGVAPNGWANMAFDDDGVPASETKLIDKGKFTSFMHDRVTAAELGAKLTGNSRTESFKTKRYVRMTNTYFAPGKWKLEEMVEGIKKGMLLEKNMFGMEDPLGGGLQCTSKKGWLIENGKLTKRVSRVALSGNILDVFDGIDAVENGKSFRINTGSCGKGTEDFVPAGTGGVHLRIKGLTVSKG